MNVPFRAISVGSCLSNVKFAERLVYSSAKAGSPGDSNNVLACDDGRMHGATDERTMTMMYATLTLMAGMIAIMFVATAVSSVINAIRENEAVKDSVRRSVAL
jgi:hypothetical protein